MNNPKIIKILAFISLFAELIISFILFSNIRNLITENQINLVGNGIYVLIILLIIFAFILFVSAILSSRQSEAEDLSSEIKILDDDSSKKDENSNDVSQDELLDIDSYIKKILPKEDSKMDLVKYTEKLLSNIAKEFNIVQGLFFVKEKESDVFNIAGKYAYFGEEEPKSFKVGESLSGQAAKNKTVLNLKEIPENYVTILSGLGSSSPNHLNIIPIVYQDETIAIIELASFKEFKKNFNQLFEGMNEQIGKALSKY
jgi:putative methionine-R-sulfoxide reductase with GAF domain